MERTYLCAVHGVVDDRRIETRLVEDRGDGLRGSTRTPYQGERAVTHVRRLEALPDTSLLEVRLETGKTHQIRIHLAEQGHPLVGERVYVRDYLRKHNRQDDFIKVAERLLWHKPDNIALSRELAGLYLRRDDARRGLQKLQVCFKADPRDVETLALLAQAFQTLGQKGKTVSVLKELARTPAMRKRMKKVGIIPPSSEDSDYHTKYRPTRSREVLKKCDIELPKPKEPLEQCVYIGHRRPNTKEIRMTRAAFFKRVWSKPASRPPLQQIPLQ